MDAGTLPIKTIFGQDRRHVVPLFQRPYVWKRESQWEPLWEDIRKMAERLCGKQPSHPHFMGAVVFEQLPTQTGEVETRLIVDGQQRLTTIQLILEALADTAQGLRNEKFHRALLKLTRNDDPASKDPDDQFKVWPTNVDQDHFKQVMLAGSPQELRLAYGVKPTVSQVGHPIADAYLFFHGTIAEWLRANEPGADERLEALFYTLRDGVRMVVIDLEKDDDPQLIFETLNARGTPLLPSDLIKNFLFHRAGLEGADMSDLYRRHWRPFDVDNAYWRQELGRGHAKRARIDTYFQHYLTLKTGDELPVAHLYASFRKFASQKDSPPATAHLQSLNQYSAIYKRFDAMPEGSRQAIFFRRLSLMELTTAYPFLLEFFAKFDPNDEDVPQTLVHIESFLVRRMVCQLNTRGYNKLFLDLLDTLRSDNGPPSVRISRFLSASEAESNRWPNDAEFHQSWLETPLYRVLVRQRVRLLLEALEAQLTTSFTEKVELKDTLTIEHIMPQGWRTNWPLSADALRETAAQNRDRLIHTIGNLTLLTKKLNPSVSNAAWFDKKQAFQKHCALTMNRQLQENESWDEAAIAHRSEELFKVAKTLWPGP